MSLLALEAVRKSSRRCVSQAARTTWACPHCRLVFHSADLLELHQPLHQPLHAGAVSAETTAAQSEPCCPECGAVSWKCEQRLAAAWNHFGGSSERVAGVTRLVVAFIEQWLSAGW